MERVYGLVRMNPGLAGEFKRTFGRSLKDFWSVYHGFDIVAFDEWVKCPDGISLRDHLKNTVSGSASVLVERLLINR